MHTLRVRSPETHIGTNLSGEGPDPEQGPACINRDRSQRIIWMRLDQFGLEVAVSLTMPLLPTTAARDAPSQCEVKM
jgi:hypothetical protein